jgi:predicted metal-dependent phosphoesterase TrpH
VRFELHCHSTCSDGLLAPAEVALRAASRGVDVFALTDHDTCAGCDVAVPAGATVLRGVELSCDDQGRSVHVLAYRPSPALEARLADVREARRRRLRVMAARLLSARGIAIDVEPVIAAAGDRSVGRPDLARLMVERGVVGSMKEAFSRHLYDGGPVDVPHRDLAIAEALALGDGATRFALAHPHQHAERAAGIIGRHRARGLDGIEVHYGIYDAAERHKWLAVGRELDLVATAGSDNHRDGDAQHGVDVDGDGALRLRDWLGV